MSKVEKVKLLSEHTSGVPPVICFFILRFPLSLNLVLLLLNLFIICISIMESPKKRFHSYRRKCTAVLSQCNIWTCYLSVNHVLSFHKLFLAIQHCLVTWVCCVICRVSDEKGLGQGVCLQQLSRGAWEGVFRQNSGGQQSGCLGTASSRLKRLETTLTLTHPSLADTGRTSVLICKHAPPWSTSKAFACRKPLLPASFGEIAIAGERRSIAAREKEACMRAHFYPKDAGEAEVAGNKLDGARSLHSLLVNPIFLQLAQFRCWYF